MHNTGEDVKGKCNEKAKYLIFSVMVDIYQMLFGHALCVWARYHD